MLEGPAEIWHNDQSARSLEGKLLAGKYRVQKLLGEGGMGEVFLAEHEAIGKRMALKVLRSEQAQKSDVVERFRLEARSASRIQHPNVVQVFDFGQIEDGRFYLALEYLEGLDLADQLHKTKMLDPLRALYITLQLCAGLSAAHASGIIHRDMKPENVFLQPNKNGFDDVKIVDFGIAKMREISEHASINPPPIPEGSGHRRITKAGSIFGTPEYMAPEQAAGREVDHRADLYAVGVILYEMLTGKVPFSSDGMIETLTKHITERVRPPRELNPNISPALEAVILKALAKTPAERPANMDAFAEQLQLTPEGVRLMETIRQASPLSLSGIPSPRRLPPPSAEDLERASQAPLPLVTPARTSTSLDHLDPATPSSGTALPASTMTAATSIFSSWPSSRRGVAVGAVGAVLLGAVGGGLALTRPWFSGALPATSISIPLPMYSLTIEPSANTPVSGITEKNSSLSPSTSAISPSTSASTPTSSGVLLHVVTIPSGALILKGDFQVCDSSPCELWVKPNEAVELIALRGHLRGVAKVLAQREQTVQIRLFQRTQGAPGKPPSAPSGRNVAPIPMCEFTDGDLKILRPCQ